MESRSLSQLYELLLIEFDNKSSQEFICNNIDYLKEKEKITLTEFQLLKGHFRDNLPTNKINSEFLEHPSYNSDFSYTVRWKSQIKGANNQRRLFILKMIEITS